MHIFLGGFFFLFCFRLDVYSREGGGRRIIRGPDIRWWSLCGVMVVVTAVIVAIIEKGAGGLSNSFLVRRNDGRKRGDKMS